MRRIELFLTGLLLLVLPVGVFSKDKENHSLVKQWTAFYEAQSKDLPLKEMEALDLIKKEALSRRLDWDFYDAAVKYSEVVSRRNWKDREKARKNLEKEVAEYDSPVMSFCFSRYRVPQDTLSALVDRRKSELQRSYHPEFYGTDSSISSFEAGKVVLSGLKNDYEFVQWSLYSKAPGRYPLSCLEEYKQIISSGAETVRMTGLLEAFTKKYSSKAVSLLSRQKLLQMRFSALKSKEESSSADYRSLDEDCRKFIADRSAFSLRESAVAACPDKVDGIRKELREKETDFSIEDDRVRVILRNTEAVTVKLTKDSKTVFENRLKNSANSFYVPDTLYCGLPVLDDGEYDISGLKYSRHSISLSGRMSSDGYGLFAADYITGEPLKSVDLHLVRMSGEQVAEVRGFEMKPGYNTLPAALQPYKDENMQIYASFTDSDGHYRSSERMYLSPYMRGTRVPGGMQAELLTDRSAYHPGDTVRFKAVAWLAGPVLKPLPKGTVFVASLLDAGGKELAGQTLSSSEFSSMDGMFALGRAERNGIFSLQIKDKDGKVISWRQVRVDDFILPTFDLVWGKEDRTYLPGDTVSLTGNVKAYSGHNLSAARVTCEIRNYSDRVSGNVDYSPDGSFKIDFPTDPDKEYGYYTITVRVSDATGETLEFSKAVSVYKRPSLGVEILNSLKAECDRPLSVIASDSVLVHLGCKEHSGEKVGWALAQNGEILCSGTAEPGKDLPVSLSGKPSGLYELNFNYLGVSQTERVLKISKDGSVVPAAAGKVFCQMPGRDMEVRFAVDKSAWIVAELYGEGDKLLESRFLEYSGPREGVSPLETLHFDYKKEYPDNITLNILYFRDKQAYPSSFALEREREEDILPLDISAFTDKALPGTEYEIVLKTGTGVECAATIYDKAIETVSPNGWNPLPPVREKTPSNVYYDTRCGVNGTLMPVLYKGAMMTASRLSADSVPAVNGNAEPAVRKDFAPLVCWQPSLKSDSKGMVRLKFRTGDRLSTFIVQFLAHDKTLRSAVIRKEMTVTLPVKVAVSAPAYLYDTDSYVLHLAVSNALDSEVAGKLVLEYPGGTAMEEIAIPAGSVKEISFPINGIEAGELPLTVKFTSKSGSDALRTVIPVRRSVVEIRESHSAVLLSSDNRQAVTDSLRKCFVNADASSSEVKEISIEQMVRSALDVDFRTESSDALSLSASLYAATLASSLGGTGLSAGQKEALAEKIRACVNPDGGFAWLPGMKSNPSVTAVVLQRMASMRGKNLDMQGLEALVANAVKYLDKQYFSDEKRPAWCGGLSFEQYCLTRAMFPELKFDVRNDKPLKDFRKEVKKFLAPSGKRGLEGQILSKARRYIILKSLTGGEDGMRLASLWGVKEQKKLRLSAMEEISSLSQYAVPHAGGGCCFPNAVMPWRGLQESELYAHSLLCGLLDDEAVAEGIRLWIMIQKETQQWKADPAYMEAIATVLDGSRATLNTRVLYMDATSIEALDRVAPSSNGFAVERKYFRNGKQIGEGEVLRVGEKITAEYRCSSSENRSFVRLSVPRPAGLRPVNQRSGNYGWWLNVLPDRTEYWFDSYPEEKTVIREEFFVTQEGRFNSGIPEIESMYAPHYRANDRNFCLNLGDASADL